jgi:hypothetical protein
MTITRTAALVRHNARLAARDPGPLSSRLAMPVVMLVLLQPFYRATLPTTEEGITQATTGMMVMFSMLAVSIVGAAILNERLWHTWNRLRATPARPVEILIGEVICPFAIFLLQQAIVVITAAVVFDLHVTDPTLLLGAMVTWGITLLCCGALRHHDAHTRLHLCGAGRLRPGLHRHGRRPRAADPPAALGANHRPTLTRLLGPRHAPLRRKRQRHAHRTNRSRPGGDRRSYRRTRMLARHTGPGAVSKNHARGGQQASHSVARVQDVACTCGFAQCSNGSWER